jgi:hypothetical protein
MGKEGIVWFGDEENPASEKERGFFIERGIGNRIENLLK